MAASFHTRESPGDKSPGLSFFRFGSFFYGLIQTNKLGCYFCLMVPNQTLSIPFWGLLGLILLIYSDIFFKVAVIPLIAYLLISP